MSSITLKTSEIEGALKIFKLDLDERRSSFLKDTESNIWPENQNKKVGAFFRRIVEGYALHDLIADLCKFSVDGAISLNHKHFVALKPFIRTN